MYKVSKDNIKSRGDFFSVKNSIRGAANVGIIDNPDAWLRYMDARNQTSHTYVEKIVEQVYERLKDFPRIVDQLTQNVEKFME